MRVFRVEREKYLSSTLSGIGASMSDGCQWNSLYTPLVYTAESRALAMLEVSVHLDISEDLPTDRYYVEVDIPSEVEILELKPESLPENWDAKPPLRPTQLIGDSFVLSQAAAVLKVPSSIVPFESNYLINPQHPDAAKILIISTKTLSFDYRFRE